MISTPAIRSAGIPIEKAGGLPPLRAAAATPSAAPDRIIGSLSADLSRMLRPQAAYRWLLPSLGAITPQYIESTLRGALAGNHVQAWELFDLMLDTWPELVSCANELTEGVQGRKIVFEPFCEEDEEPTDDAARKCKVVSAALRRMRPDPAADENDLDGTVKDIMSGWFMGQVVLETNWDAGYGSEELNILNSATLGPITAPRSTFWVHPVCYAWNMEGRLGLRQELGAMRATTRDAKQKATVGNLWNSTTFQPRPTDILEFPPEKFLVAIHKSKSGTALGGSMLRPLAWWWCASNFSADWLLNLSQLFGIPFRWVNYDPSLPDPLKNELDAMMQNMGSSGWARFPQGTELKFLEAGKGGENSPQDALLDRCDRYARLLILGQTLSGGQSASKGGGKAFGAVESAVKTQRIDAACKYVAGVLNTQLVPSVVRLNFNNAEELPTVKFMDEREGGLEDSQRDQTLATAGLKIGVNYLRKKYDIPEPEEDEETIGGQAEPAPTIPGAELKLGEVKPAAEDAEAVEEIGALQAKAVETEAAQKTEIADTLHDMLLPLLKRLEAIANVDDGAIQQHMIEKLLKDFPQIADAIKADDSLAKKLNPQLSQALIAGLTQKTP